MFFTQIQLAHVLERADSGIATSRSKRMSESVMKACATEFQQPLAEEHDVQQAGKEQESQGLHWALALQQQDLGECVLKLHVGLSIICYQTVKAYKAITT